MSISAVYFFGCIGALVLWMWMWIDEFKEGPPFFSFILLWPLWLIAHTIKGAIKYGMEFFE